MHVQRLHMYTLIIHVLLKNIGKLYANRSKYARYWFGARYDMLIQSCGQYHHQQSADVLLMCVIFTILSISADSLTHSTKVNIYKGFFFYIINISLMWALFTIMFYARIPPALVHLMHIQRLSSVVVVAQQQQEVKVVEGEPWAFVQKKRTTW